jgi:mannosyl-oligosaccharide glucosidase
MRGLWLLLGLPLVPVALAEVTIEDDKSLLWGPYRPNLYFGMRPRIPQSLMTGMLWFGAHDFQSINRTFTRKLFKFTSQVLINVLGVRHACETGDNLDGYTWTEFDARKGGTQVIKDSSNNVKLTTELIKFPGGEHGGSWAARIRGEPIDPGE